MSTAGDYVNCHLHSDGSILDGASSVESILDEVKSKGMKACALTDHGSMLNIVDWYKGCKSRDIKPLLGEEFYICKEGINWRPIKAKDKKHDADIALAIESEDKMTETDLTRANTPMGNSHLIVIAQNETGYHNLCKMSEISHRDGFYRHPRIDYDILEKYNEGLIITTACMFGDFSKLVKYNRLDEARDFVAKMVGIFGKRFFCELQYHGFEDQSRYIPQAIKIANDVGANIVATQDVHYAKKDQWILQDSLFCISQGIDLDDPTRKRRACKEMYVKDRLEMEHMLGGVGVPKVAFDNTLLIAEMVEDYELQPKNYLLPQQFGKTVVQDKVLADKFLREMCYSGWKEKIVPIVKDNPYKKKLYQERINFELAVISSSGFSSYFLIVQDFINYSNSKNRSASGERGSCAGSMVAYLTGITDIDPIKYDLLFERFLVPGRPSMPDIDVDVEDRDFVVNYLEDTYGRDKISPILNRTEITAKSGLIKVSAILGDRKLGEGLSKAIKKEHGQTPTFAKVESTIPEIKDAKQKYPRLFEIAEGLEGTTIGLMGHASGVIISPVPISDVIPRHSYKGTMYTAFDKSQIEYCKMIKLDILGIDTLVTLKNCVKLIKEQYDIDIDLKTISLEDPKVYELLSSGDTTGIFQFESQLMISILKTIKPANLTELASCNAIGRPGALDGDNMVQHFADRKFGIEKVTYDHPDLEPILKDTQGLMIMQEQLMSIARVLAGFSYTEVDEFRKCFSYKDKSIMDRNRSKFIDGCMARNYTSELANKLFDSIQLYANYGFNKSHAIAYAKRAAVCGWLKKYYPLEFIVSCLNTRLNVSSDQEDTVKFVIDLERHGYSLVLPDINKSLSKSFVITKELDNNNKTIVYCALGAIKGVAQNAVDDLINMRPFYSLNDILLKAIASSCSVKNLILLAKVGAFRDIAPNTPYLVATLEKRMEILKKAHGSIKNKYESLLVKHKKMQDRLAVQDDLFGYAPPKVLAEPNYLDYNLYKDYFSERFTESSDLSLEPAAEFIKSSIRWQMELIGYTVSGTLLDEYAEVIKASNARMIVSDFVIEDLVKEQEEVRVVGLLTHLRTLNDRNGNRMAIATISDGRSEARVVIFSSLYLKYKESHWSSHYGNRVVVIDGLKSKDALLAKSVTFLTKDSDPYEEVTEISTSSS